MYSVNMAAIDPRREELRNADVFIVDGIEFIRKDTLVKWLKDAISDITGINDVEGNYEAGQADAYWDVIDKINEM